MGGLPAMGVCKALQHALRPATGGVHMLGATGGQKYERVCEAEAIRKARGGEAGRRRAEACLPREAPLSSSVPRSTC